MTREQSPLLLLWSISSMHASCWRFWFTEMAKLARSMVSLACMVVQARLKTVSTVMNAKKICYM